MFIRETPKDGKGMPVDWWGIALLAVAVGSLQTVLEKGESEDWFATPYITALSGCICSGSAYCSYGERQVLTTPSLILGS